MVLYFSVNIVQFLDMSIQIPYSYAILCLTYFLHLNSDNLSKNLNWSGGLYVIPTVICLVFGINSIKIFSILLEM